MPRSASILSRSATSAIKRMPLGTAAPDPPRPSVRWVRAPRIGRGRARGAPRTSPYSTPHRAKLQARIAARPGNGCSRCVRKHRRHARPSRPPALVSARTSRRCYARACSRTPSARPRRPKTDAKGGCSLGHPFDPVTIPHDIENRGVATRIDQERNPQVSGAFQRSPQVTESARLNLSRWRHGFEPRWDYKRAVGFVPSWTVGARDRGRARSLVDVDLFSSVRPRTDPRQERVGGGQLAPDVAEQIGDEPTFAEMAFRSASVRVSESISVEPTPRGVVRPHQLRPIQHRRPPSGPARPAFRQRS